MLGAPEILHPVQLHPHSSPPFRPIKLQYQRSQLNSKRERSERARVSFQIQRSKSSRSSVYT